MHLPKSSRIGITICCLLLLSRPWIWKGDIFDWTLIMEVAYYLSTTKLVWDRCESSRALRHQVQPSILPRKSDTLAQCWFYVGPQSSTLGQHQTNIGWLRSHHKVKGNPMILQSSNSYVQSSECPYLGGLILLELYLNSASCLYDAHIRLWWSMGPGKLPAESRR